MWLVLEHHVEHLKSNVPEFHVIFEILLYYTWIRSFLMLNINLSSNGCLVDRLAIAKWCRRAGRRRLRRCEYRGVAWGFLLYLCLWSLDLGSDFGLLCFVLVILCWIWRRLCYHIWCIWDWIMLLRLWYDFGVCWLFCCITLIKKCICIFWIFIDVTPWA